VHVRRVYEARTLHNSSLSPARLSPASHAITGIRVGDHIRALEYLYRSALVDLPDNQGNTAYGIHIASAGDSWRILVNGYGGLRLRHGHLTLKSWLPDQRENIHFRLRWRGNSRSVAIQHRDAIFCLHTPAAATEELVVAGQSLTLTANEPATVSLAGMEPALTP
jgi:trehalose/maltose hydrolase-like predicted phosphorylase